MVCSELKTASDDTIILSNYSVFQGTAVQVGCREFGRRLTSGAKFLACSNADAWVPTETTFKCEWNGELNTYEKLIIGLGSAGGGVLLFGFLLICCLALKYRQDGREKDSDVNSYPPSAINEKVGYAQYGNGGGGGGIRGYRPSGNYEKKITSEPRNDFKTDSRYDTSKRDPILWSGYGSNPSSNPSRDAGRPEPADGYQFYSGKNPQNPSSQYDNRAFERNDYERGSGYRDTGYQGTNYQQGKREDYRWNGQLPRAHMARDDRHNRQY
ncbi:uncharacterized protein LOC143051649 [Mytilus galloprovincialis]|uniref:uncharacterized protein LOC143051649 n=1 Tax=Mytilus galloprovincialis TaxID=29158 RepID=UPI003F7BC7FB